MTPTSSCTRHMQERKKAITHAKATSDLGLLCTLLDRDTLELLVHADVPFAGNDDQSSQIGSVVTLRDGADI